MLKSEQKKFTWRLRHRGGAKHIKTANHITILDTKLRRLQHDEKARVGAQTYEGGWLRALLKHHTLTAKPNGMLAPADGQPHLTRVLGKHTCAAKVARDAIERGALYNRVMDKFDHAFYGGLGSYKSCGPRRRFIR